MSNGDQTSREAPLGLNPRYVAYATAHGKSPAEMMAADDIEWPGGCMTGFILWMSERKQAFYKARPGCFLDRHAICDMEAWDEFLVNSPKVKEDGDGIIR